MPKTSQEGNPAFKPADVESFLRCERKLWLERAEAAQGMELPSAPMGAKREADSARVRACFQKHATRTLGASALFPREAGRREATATDSLGVSREAMPDALAPPVALPDAPSGADQKARTIPAPSHRRALSFSHGSLRAAPHAVALSDGRWSLLSVKASSATREDALKKAQKDELFALALQAWVFERANAAQLSSVGLSFLNKEFSPSDPADQAELFVEVDVLDIVREKAARFDAELDGWLEGMEDVVSRTAMPQVAMGDQCKENGGCPFMAFCKKHEPEGEPCPVELLPGVGGKALAKKLRGQGVSSLTRATDAQLAAPKNPKAQALYRRMRDAHGLGLAILEGHAKAALDALPYPRFYFDFEGIDFAVPRWAGVAPYVQVPFQWSCHVESSPGVFEHAQFLDASGLDPSLACIQAMLSAMPAEGAGPIVVYSATYEKSRIKELGQRHPEHRAAMERYLDRIVDLLPLTEESYYHPDMRGSFSIKAVLPCVAPDMSYKDLEGVQDGSGAQIAYLAIIDPATPEDERQAAARQLLRYCAQDTWAMVRLAHFLAGDPAPSSNVPTVASHVIVAA